MMMGVVGKGVFGRGCMRGEEGWVSGVMRVSVRVSASGQTG